MRERRLRSFEPQGFLQFLIADACCLLVGDMVLSKSSIGDTQSELPIPIFHVDDAVGVVPAMGLELKTQILDLLFRDGSFLRAQLLPASLFPYNKTRAWSMVGLTILLRFQPENLWDPW